MEDAHFCAFPVKEGAHNEIGLFCVFDGHAGSNCSRELTTAFPRIFLKHWEKLNPSSSQTTMAMVVDAGMRVMDQTAVMSSFWREVYKEVDENLKQYEYEGSTATTLLIWKANTKVYLQCSNIGDSTAFICRNGDAILLSQDHNLSLKSERARVTESGIKLEPSQSRLNGLAVTRAFGDHFVKEVKCGVICQPYTSEMIELDKKDTRVIVASDGLWDVMTGQHAFDLVKEVEDSQEAANKLLRTALSKPMCRDNVTIIVINLK